MIVNYNCDFGKNVSISVFSTFRRHNILSLIEHNTEYLQWQHKTLRCMDYPEKQRHWCWMFWCLQCIKWNSIHLHCAEWVANKTKYEMYLWSNGSREIVITCTCRYVSISDAGRMVLSLFRDASQFWMRFKPLKQKDSVMSSVCMTLGWSCMMCSLFRGQRKGKRMKGKLFFLTSFIFWVKSLYKLLKAPLLSSSFSYVSLSRCHLVTLSLQHLVSVSLPLMDYYKRLGCILKTMLKGVCVFSSSLSTNKLFLAQNLFTHSHAQRLRPDHHFIDRTKDVPPSGP